MTAAEAPPFLALLADDHSRQVFAAVAGERGWTADGLVPAAVDQAAEILAGLPRTPPLLILDLSGSTDPLTALDDLANHCDPGVTVLAVGDINDVNLYHRLRDLGVADYLVKPLDPRLLANALEAATAPPPAAESDTRRARISAVVGVRGGIGATTVAVNLAWTMAESLGRQTALLDLDLFYGATALSLDLEPARGLREALEAPERLDSLFLERTLVRAGDRLAVLGTEEPLEEPFRPAPDAVSGLLEKLGADRDCIVIDLPRNDPDMLRQAFQAADDVVIVTDQTFLAARDTLRMIRFMGDVAAGRAPRILVNQGNRPGEIAKSEFERGIERTVDVVLPRDDKSFTEAGTTGRPVVAVAPKGRAATALTALARDLCPATSDQPDARPSGSLLNRLFKR